MKTTNKQKIQQVALNYSSDIDFEDLINPYKKMYYKIILFFSD